METQILRHSQDVSLHERNKHVHSKSVDQLRAQLLAKAVYEFQVELIWFSRDLVVTR